MACGGARHRSLNMALFIVISVMLCLLDYLLELLSYLPTFKFRCPSWPAPACPPPPRSRRSPAAPSPRMPRRSEQVICACLCSCYMYVFLIFISCIIIQHDLSIFVFVVHVSFLVILIMSSCFDVEIKLRDISGGRLCTLIGVPCCLSMLSTFSTFANVLF